MTLEKNNIMVMAIMPSALYDDTDYDSVCDDNITDNGLAIVNVCGEVTKQLCDDVAYSIKDLIQDKSVNAICLCVNSPGGGIVGLPELTQLIAESTNIKPIYAFVDELCASAALWFTSACTSIFVTPSANIGSIGVFSIFENDVEAYKQQGVSFEIFSAGKYKLLGSPLRDWTDDDREIVQEEIDKTYTDFTSTITTNRGNVESETMQGLIYTGEEAIQLNLADMVVQDIDDLLTIIDRPVTTATNNIEGNQ